MFIKTNIVTNLLFRNKNNLKLYFAKVNRFPFYEIFKNNQNAKRFQKFFKFHKDLHQILSIGNPSVFN